MCGIIGALANRDVTPILVEGLRRLEYRGYDSAGVAVLEKGEIARVRANGKVAELAKALVNSPVKGTIGIAHTRWATHGEPSEANAHPHNGGDKITLVHNGIIENHEELREKLKAAGYVFTSQTDTEVVAHLVDQELKACEGDVIDITRDGYSIETSAGDAIERELKRSELSDFSTEKGEYKHYMLKEIYEQPTAIRKTIEGAVSADKLIMDSIGKIDQALLARVKNIHLVACGTSSYAAGVARYWIEDFAGVPATVEIASEYRYRKVAVPEDTLYITLSQSGETADSMAALEETKNNPNYIASLAICNVPESSMTRVATATLLTKAGTEIGVASTKAFTTQLAALLIFTGMLARAKGVNGDTEKKIASGLTALPALIDKLYVMAEEGSDINDAEGFKILRVPKCPEVVAPIVFTVTVQLLSYHVAVMRGTDVDQPRNLAKSVTVE
eukprot:maker-scaffold2920_size11315-snap-gene-0.3 protein:Tk05806 transcript:maker-scaffold2920_size11315-snap-gene-0.3-mRNA-1 annotation:"glucosamine--fructose-6-phosphate aminotransferase"